MEACVIWKFSRPKLWGFRALYGFCSFNLFVKVCVLAECGFSRQMSHVWSTGRCPLWCGMERPVGRCLGPVGGRRHRVGLRPYWSCLRSLPTTEFDRRSCGSAASSPAASAVPGCAHVRAVCLRAELTLSSLSVPLLTPEDFPCSKIYCLK